ncbi:MAG: sugar transferase [Clostridia bacterium]|nr:sugar transferase [Clostridia bacterium]
MLYRWVKRLLDIVLSFLMIIILALPMLLIALCIRIESKGGAVFRQERLGRGGKVFWIYKFRSMCVGAESKGTGVYSGKGDTRVTRVGKLIRATSLDELPQLFNVLKGDMSFIGPRPVLTYHPWQLSEYTEKQKRRFEVRPGITGLAQINGRKNTPWVERIKYDIMYVDGLSFLTDLKIAAGTVAKVFKRESNLSELSEDGKAIPTNINTEKEEVG